MSQKEKEDGKLKYTEDEDEGKTCRFYVVFLSCFATIGSLLFGYDTGIVSGSMLLIGDYFSLSTVWKEAIVSATIGAAAISALVAGSFSDIFGRKKVIMMASFTFTAGSIIMAVADNKEVLLVGRLIDGVGIGFASMAVPLYISEASPPSIRGALVTLSQLSITFGILVSSLIAGAFSTDKENGWRYMLGLSAVPSAVQFVGFFVLPESPRWYVKKRRIEDAREILVKLRETDNVNKELNEIQKAVEVEEDAVGAQENFFSTFIKILQTQPVRKALLLGVLLHFFVQLCGVNTVVYYSASILRVAGFSSELAIWLVCIPNSVFFFGTFIGICAVEKAGRKILTLSSFVGVIIGLFTLGIGFHLSVIHTPSINVTAAEGNFSCAKISDCNSCITSEDRCGYCFEDGLERTSGSCLPLAEKHQERFANANLNISFRCNEDNYLAEKPKYVWADSYCPSDFAWVVILGLALFAIGFAPGLGPMSWTINSEIYPLWARSTAISIATAVCWMTNLIVSFTFLSLLETITTYGTFYLYGGISIIGLIIMGCLLPETKNKTLEEVEELFMSESYRQKHRIPPKYATDNAAFDNDIKF